MRNELKIEVVYQEDHYLVKLNRVYELAPVVYEVQPLINYTFKSEELATTFAAGLMEGMRTLQTRVH